MKSIGVECTLNFVYVNLSLLSDTRLKLVQQIHVFIPTFLI